MGERADRFSVLIPTFRRPDVLARCLRAVGRQTRPAGQVVVTVRQDDAATAAAVEGLTAELAAAGVVLQAVAVAPGPVTAAMAAGLAATTGELVAITDDDAEPRPDWLERIADHFADPAVGGVGGRDWQPHERWDEPDVGRVQWFGRAIGNHHLGAGPARRVEVLKGVNCAFRGDVLREVGFDQRMWGQGTVIHWELSLSFAFLARGWQLVYDPAVGVDHHVAPRHDIDQRHAFNAEAHRNIVHNETLCLLEYLPPGRRAAFAAWAAAVGTGESPGVAQVARLLVKRRPQVAARWWATVRGRAAGVRSYMGDGTR